MGQPVHALSAHSGHSQLWSWAAFTHAHSYYFGPFHHRLCLAYKYLVLFLTIPFFVPSHPWASDLTFFIRGISRFRPAKLYRPIPNFIERPYLWSRLYRLLPRRVLFKDGDQDVWQDAIIEGKVWGKRVWGQVKTFNIRGVTCFIIQGLALYGALASPSSVKRLTARSLKPGWFEARNRVPYLIAQPTPRALSRRPRHQATRPAFWV